MEPLLFIDSINSKKHILLVYNDAILGKTIEFHFIKKGLEKKEYCIYMTHGEPKDAEIDMKKHGIDVQYFKNKDLLNVYQMPNLMGGPNILDEVDSILKKILKNPHIPFRIVGRVLPDVSLEVAMAVQEHVERTFHNSTLKKLNGSVLCSYDFSQIQANNKWRQWLGKLQSSHHASILNTDTKGTVTVSINDLD